MTVADTFVKRESADDGWGREFEIVLPLANPEVWQPVRNRLEATLRFLSGDNEDRRDDLMAVMTAIARAKDGVPASWVLQAGPLPEEPAVRAAYIDVFRRGLSELETFLKASKLI